MIDMATGLSNGAANGLQRPESHQPAERRGKAAQERAGAEQREAGLECPPAADPVGRRSGQHEQAREDQQIGVNRPLQSRDRCVQVCSDRRQRYVHNRVVEAHDQ